MHKVCRCIAFDNSAKKTRFLHGFNLALLGSLLCTSLLTAATHLKTPDSDPQTLKRSELLSYEGQTISSVELAGRPDLNMEEFHELLALHTGDTFSAQAADETVNALKRTGQFQDIEVNLRPELEGVRVMFVLHPAIYFGVYQFPGAEQFPYTRLLQASNYVSQEPYSPVDIQKAKETLVRFFERNGFFEAQVTPEVKTDKDHGLANINFKVTLNRRARFGDLVIEGTTPEETNHLKDTLQSLRARIRMSAVRPGQAYSLKTLERATDYLRSRLQAENHLAAQVKLIGADYNPTTNR